MKPQTVIPAWRLLMLLACATALIALSRPAQAQTQSQPLFGVSLEDAQQAVAAALIAEGAADNLAATITSTRQKGLYYYKQPLDVQVKTLKYDESAQSWSANLLFVHGDEVMSAMPVSGRYEETLRIPVLTDRLRNGEMIGSEHIAFKEYPSSKLRQDTIADEKQLIGMTPRRTISKNRPVRADEVQAPALIKEGSVLKMNYRTPHMQISVMGEALEPGALGQRIRVRNKDSHIVVYAVVTSPDEVLVGDQPKDMAQSAYSRP